MFGKKSVLAILLIVMVPGCAFIAAPLDSLSKSGWSPESRKGLLEKEIVDFHTNMFWGSLPRALSFVADERKEDLKWQLTNKKKIGRIIESKVEDVIFDEQGYEATATVAVRMHQHSTNTIESYTEIELWRYKSDKGWKLETISEELV